MTINSVKLPLLSYQAAKSNITDALTPGNQRCLNHTTLAHFHADDRDSNDLDSNDLAVAPV
jgi:hypothetical protein